MRITKDKPDDSRNLREQAEKRAKQQIVEFRKQRGQDTTELVHELHVHQIELEIQNEELRNAQLELAESRNKYCELYDFAPVGYFTLNKEGLIVGANLTGAAFLGEERGNLLKSKLSHFIAPCSQDEFYLHCKQVVESGTMKSCEIKLHRKDGTEFSAQLVSVAISEQKNKYDQFHMTIIDITERKRAEEEILWKTALLESQVEANLDGVLVVDGNNQKILTNKRLNEMWKIPQDIVESKDDTAQAKYAASQTKYPDQFLEKVKYLYSHKDETTRDEVELKNGAVFDRYSSPVIDKSGNYLGRIWTFRDTTDRKRAEEALRASETKYRIVADNTYNWEFWLSPEGRFIYTSPSCERITGHKPADFEADPNLLHRLIHPEDLPKYEAHRRIVSEGHQDCEQEFRIVHSDGTQRWIGHICMPIRDETGKLLGLRGSNRDITNRKRAEEELRKERDFAQSLVETTQAIILLLDTQGHIIDFNLFMEAISGYKIEEVRGRDWFSTFIPDKDRQPLRKLFLKAVPDIQTRGNVHPIITKSGEQRQIEWYDKTLKNSAGNIIGLLSTGIDITQRQLSEKYLQEERNLLRTLIDHLPDGVYIKDKEGHILGYNKSLAESWETRGRDDITGKTDFDLFEPKVAQRYFDEERKIMQTGQPIINKEAECTDKSGNPNYLLVTKVPLQDSAGNITGLVGIHRDITERKQVEHKILEYQKHLKHLAARLMLAEEGERRRIAGEIHDEISQTLAIVNIKLDTLRNSPPFEASAAEIEEISSSVEKVIQETRTLTFELSNPLLYELGLEAAVAEWLSEQVQEKHGIATEFQDDGKAKPLDDDVKIMLFRNARELLINCIKHANAGRVRVGIRRTNGSIEVVVEDNGVGFDPADVRLTAGKKAKFGLFSVRESLENSGGHFIIESKPGAGCKAIMTAPLKNQSNKKET
jgi:PAS domain S-box-containing protein